MTRDECVALDARDPLAHVRNHFSLPEGIIYLDGNSLGALPKSVGPRLRKAVDVEWGQGLIRSWNEAGWYRAPQRIGAKIATLIGAPPDEVIVTDSTSIDLFKVLVGALRMRPGRKRVLGVVGDFPTDSYIAAGVADAFNANFESASADKLIAAIDENVAAVSLTHVNYRTGFVHDMRAITAAAHANGALIVWDLSHTAGVMPVEINAIGADFAVGCGYKYLNGGPGAPAYVFVAKRHHDTFHHPLTGWFGHADPFAFAKDFVPAQGMDKLLTGTPPILSLIAFEAALDAFEGVDMAAVRTKVQRLTQLFIDLVDERLARYDFTLASPRDAARRGAQVSLAHPEAYAIIQAVIARGVIGDFRAPDIARFGFAPLYTRYADVYDAVATIDAVMTSRAWDTPAFKSRNAVT